MVNFQDPTVIFNDFWAVAKVWHAFDGLFLWELFITLDLEWSIIRGRRPYRWTIWVYSMARIATLVAVILNILRIDDSRSINCQLWVIFEHVFAYLALACASLLIVLRIIAIWSRNKTVLVLAASVWGINIAFLIHGVVRLRAIWEPAESTCMVTNSYNFKLGVLVTLATDIILLVFMLVGLLRVRAHGGSTLKLGHFLWKQGVIWFLIATVAEIPPAVFLILNLNAALNIMFQIPALIALTIAATRMYRSLVNVSSSDIFESLQTTTGHGASLTLAKVKVLSGSGAIVPLGSMRVDVDPKRMRNSLSQKTNFASGSGSQAIPEGDLNGGREK